MQCSLLHTFRLFMYQLGTEAEWTFLELFRLHSRIIQDGDELACLEIGHP